ncbi:MAG: hypothetical protein WCA20_25140 [Candidatus Sulfotelmatobacter sp.]
MMQGQTKERLLELCAQAAVEQEPNKLLGLLKEINRLLEKNEARVETMSPASRGKSYRGHEKHTASAKA